ncbi:hypothetical protein BCR44DRAFT_223042 [Catenaria anguillulae PL171]|uniref:Uncharacterized protein n=1 Tax=Catenaria anguillulae PL171 TaxID=765915 RepID=A0A1Y2HW30_9FUNG|nr:hypothetical protein BCR44DRAFT_223042 [Catenaria anguillulae PL171]
MIFLRFIPSRLMLVVRNLGKRKHPLCLHLRIRVDTALKYNPLDMLVHFPPSRVDMERNNVNDPIHFWLRVFALATDPPPNSLFTTASKCVRNTGSRLPCMCLPASFPNMSTSLVGTGCSCSTTPHSSNCLRNAPDKLSDVGLLGFTYASISALTCAWSSWIMSLFCDWARGRGVRSVAPPDVMGGGWLESRPGTKPGCADWRSCKYCS